ncbi:pentatricopeptide repeat-containing protein At3g24000, mitochondrial-like isoform X1 [Nymphaea colorata]|uniref:Pentacotripeptide-repeat region of PRORP domain-containing protein n=1 Tax=Nymphaea colorata TaxID=210225 RepID=A0A5K0ZBL5_9MAGN|nr:pentatricopeptide repeat-containing protein At3g24000, mitochondrial-like isoform X1 [Nymphaea colorata]
MFEEMPRLNLLSPAALSSTLRNCGSLESMVRGKIVHGQILVGGLLPNVVLSTDLLLMYSRCGNLESARKMFEEMPQRNMHSWNIIIASYAQISLWREALDIYNGFQKTGFRPDHYTIPCVLKACSGAMDLLMGRKLHGCVVVSGYQDNVIVCSGLVDMYVKCGRLCDARQAFDEMSQRDVVSWNVVISGLVRAGYGIEALRFFCEMHRGGVRVDRMTVPSVLTSCGQAGDLAVGKGVHGIALKLVLFSDIAVGNALIDMYAKSGCLHEAHQVFVEMPQRDVITWTSLIWCYGIHGRGKDALVLFDEMVACGVMPNSATFTAALTSCSHGGLLDEGRGIFSMMRQHYGLDPSVEHYACMVDLLGRHELLDEALAFIKGVPLAPTASIWGALLSSCRTYNNVEIGEIAAAALFELEASNSSNYIVLASIYEAVGQWECVSELRSRMRKLGIVKTPGCSWLTVKNRVYCFAQGKSSHPKAKVIHEVLDGLSQLMMMP